MWDERPEDAASTERGPGTEVSDEPSKETRCVS